MADGGNRELEHTMIVESTISSALVESAHILAKAFVDGLEHVFGPSAADGSMTDEVSKIGSALSDIASALESWHDDWRDRG